MMFRKWLLGMACLFVMMHAQASPSIELRDFEGKSRNVSEVIGQGKWTIVVLWAHDCGICAREIHHMSTFHEKHREQDAVVLGVSLDGQEYVEQARQFVSRHKLPFLNLLAEPDEGVIMQFGGGRFVGTPTHYFYDPSGRIVGRKIGPLKGEDVEDFIKAFNEGGYSKK